MPTWGLQIVLALIPIIKTLIEKLVPSHVTKKKEFKTKKKMQAGLDRFQGKTIEQIAIMGRQQNGR